MKFKYISLILVMAFSICHAERFIIPTKYPDQQEVLMQGASMLVSDKDNSVLMYQTSETIKNNHANFYFIISNKSDYPINMHFHKLKVTDQWGRPVKVISKRAQIAKKKNAKKWHMIGSALSTGVDIINAQNAGHIHYQTHTYDHTNTNYNHNSPHFWANGSVCQSGQSVTQGTVHCEALRQQALRQAELDGCHREMAIRNHYDSWIYGLNNYYFDSNTIFPGNRYAANFQIELSSKVENDLQYLLFTYDLEGEQHTFCFYCGKEKKKWYSFR